MLFWSPMHKKQKRRDMVDDIRPHKAQLVWCSFLTNMDGRVINYSAAL